jgi:uncharacterized protein (DUF952 family)/flavin reductase (DIM6/NTAB) family NADH-FMN oxidoreductase RutF
LYIYHIVKKEEWETAQKDNEYSRESLKTDGFIHCCYKNQIAPVMEQWFKGQKGLVIVKIDPSLLNVKVHYENLEGGQEKFPHIYGPINLSAVVKIEKNKTRPAMNRIDISIKDFIARSHTIFDKQWFLLCCGDFEKKDFNCMTISWGSLGTIWNLPLAMVVVRMSRYTFQFMEKYNTFTLNAFPEDTRQPLDVLGKSSGRDMDKINQSGYIPMASSVVQAPTFTEAELTLECRKIYWDDMNPAHFLDERIWDNYENRDYHRIYFGEVLRIAGIKKYTV